MAMQEADVVPVRKPGSAACSKEEIAINVTDQEETSNETLAGDDVGVSMVEMASPVKKQEEGEEKCNIDGRERLKRHRNEVAGRVRVPDLWGQEDFLKDWSDCTNQFDVSLSSSKIMSARDALLEEGKRRETMKMNVNSSGLRMDSRCFLL